jgi:hypothetical protein
VSRSALLLSIAFSFAAFFDLLSLAPRRITS